MIGGGLKEHEPACRSISADVNAVVHKLLYAAMILYPLSGIVLPQAVGRPVTLSDFGPLPQIIPFDPAIPAIQSAWVKGAGDMHKGVMFFAIHAILALHVLGALKHALIDRNPAMFRRMWGK